GDAQKRAAVRGEIGWPDEHVRVGAQARRGRTGKPQLDLNPGLARVVDDAECVLVGADLEEIEGIARNHEPATLRSRVEPAGLSVQKRVGRGDGRHRALRRRLRRLKGTVESSTCRGESYPDYSQVERVRRPGRHWWMGTWAEYWY